MYCTRPVQRSPSTLRIVTRAAPRRQASYFAGFPSSPFYTRTVAPFDPFRGFERLLEDITSPTFPFAPQKQLTLPRQQSFQPRFDVRENNGTYELRGEIPGVESENLEVEFADAQTLVVRGRTESQNSRGTRPQAIQREKGKERLVEDNVDNAVATEAAADNSDAASVHSSGSYQKPTVEDATEGVAVDNTADTTTTAASTEAQNTPATTPGVETQAAPIEAQPAQEQSQPQQQQQQQSHYWISERSTGSFQRVFKFPHRVDQEAVTASLKNGILNIVVPKAVKPEAKRIRVE